MRKQGLATISYRPNEKAKVYLSHLGFLDLRTNRIRADAIHHKRRVNDFINQSIIFICETKKPFTNAQATTEELQEAYLEFLIQQRAEEIDQLKKEIGSLHAMKLSNDGAR